MCSGRLLYQKCLTDRNTSIGYLQSFKIDDICQKTFFAKNSVMQKTSLITLKRTGICKTIYFLHLS